MKKKSAGTYHGRSEVTNKPMENGGGGSKQTIGMVMKGSAHTNCPTAAQKKGR